MKSFSQFTEAAFAGTTSPVTPGNLNNGVMNHYIPIENIVINVRNIFAPWFGLVVEPGEDGRTLKVYNSTFSSPEAVDAVLNFKPDGRTSLREYVAMQGLPLYKTVSSGNTLVVYFYSTDIAGQEDPAAFAGCPVPPALQPLPTPYEEALKSCTDEELSSVLEEAGEETEMRDILNKTFYDLAGTADQTESDKKWAAAVGENVHLPNGYYWANVKDEDGHKSIALRKKITKRQSFGRSNKYAVSLINIYNNGKNAIWVGCFDRKDQCPTEDVELIDGILSFIGAVPTQDPCVFTFNKPVLGENVNEERGGELGIVYTVYDGDGQPIESFTTERDAKAAADKFASDNNVKCVVKKEKI